MKDIEKMKRDFAKAIAMAERENELEAKYGFPFHIIEYIGKDKPVSYVACASGWSTDEHKLTDEEIGRLMCDFPVTGKHKREYKKEERLLDYQFTATNDSKGVSAIQIKWFSGDFEITVAPDMESDLIASVITRTSREPASFEFSNYGPYARKPKSIPMITFNCGEQICYSGGNVVLVSDIAANSIAEGYKYAYQFDNGEDG